MAIGLYTLSEQLQAKGSGKWPETVTSLSDQYFQNVSLLLHGNGTNAAQNNTFLDSSANNFSITRNGNTTQGSFSPYGSEWSVYFDGTDDRLTIADNAALEMSSGDFTMECWFYMSVLDTATLSNLLIKGTGGSTLGYGIHVNTTGTIAGRVTTDGINAIAATSSGTVSVGQWYHVAFTRSGTTLTLWLNGSSVGTNTVSGAIYDGATNLNIGANDGGTNTFQGYISNVRIVKGTALYTSTFVPSSTPLTAIANTSLLTCNSNRFKDDSTNAFSITNNGDVKVSNFAAHKPTAAYATGTNGASAYFDGTGDYLSFASNAAFALPGAFTWEAWFYPTRQMSTTFETALTIVNATSGLQISHDAGSARWGIAESGVAWRLTTTTYPQLYAWNHIAVVRSGTGTNQTSIFLNGSRVANGTVTTSFAQGQLTIGASSSATAAVLGNMSDVRLVKGTAIYDPTLTTLTVPTSPLTAVTNTQLLCNFTNGSAIDSSRKNVFETVGNAQISTTQKKFGTAALYFDGTGDYLTTPSNTIFDITGNFTIELWAYFNTLTGVQILLARQGTVGGDGLFQVRANGSTFEFVICANGSTSVTTVTTASVLSLSTWTHLAVSRSGSSIYLFVNGTLSQTGTSGVSATSTTRPLTVGCLNDGASVGSYANAYIDEVRFTTGIARYTSSFIAPTVPFQDL